MASLKKAAYSAAIFFVVTMPFRELFRVTAVTEMRPASALPPVFGLVLGIPGALGCAIGNLAADIISGYAPVVCALGFVAQFIFGILPLCMWKFLRRVGKYRANPLGDTAPCSKYDADCIRLNSVSNVVRYICIILLNSLVMTAALGQIMLITNTGELFSGAALMIFNNNFVFGLVLGIPVLIFMSVLRLKSENIKLSLNERLVLIFLFLGVISAVLIGVFAFAEFSHVIDDPVAMWNRIYRYIAINLLIVNAVTAVFLWYIERNITAPVESIAGLAKNYIGGGKAKGALIAAQCAELCNNPTETGVLAEAFREMILDIDVYIDNITKITAERERITAELSVAAHIQASMLPCSFPPFPERNEFDLYAVMLPAKEVGGDFYDFFMVSDNTLAVVIADVSGKGVPAALFMVVAKTLIKSNAQTGKSPAEVFKTVNRMLCQNNDEGMFVTAFMGYFHIDSGRFVYVNAGHNPPLIKKSAGDYGFIQTKPSLMLAFLEDAGYREEEISLCSGDLIYLYTDGVTEAMNPEEDLFGETRLCHLLNNLTDMPLNKTLDSIKKEIDVFADGESQADDITMLIVEVIRGEVI